MIRCVQQMTKGDQYNKYKINKAAKKIAREKIIYKHKYSNFIVV